MKIRLIYEVKIDDRYEGYTPILKGHHFDLTFYDLYSVHSKRIPVKKVEIVENKKNRELNKIMKEIREGEFEPTKGLVKRRV